MHKRVAAVLSIFAAGCFACSGAGADRIGRGDGSPKRPQDPSEPYPYRVEHVRYENRIDGSILSGTLTIPDKAGRFPAALLLSGSGLQDRDETVHGHKPFKVLADHMTRRGIAVLRVDDRGVGGSTGDVFSATPETFATDALAGILFLASRNDIDSSKIGLIGHSEGALVAAIAAGQSDNVAFVVMLAGLGLPWPQNSQLAQADGLRRLGKSEIVISAALELNERIFDVVREEYGQGTTERLLRNTIDEWRASLEGEAKGEFDRFTRERPGHWSRLADQLAEPPYQFHMTADPRAYIERLRCPILGLWGERDVQVIADANLNAMDTALRKSGHTDYELKSLDGLNHLFQTCETGLTSEYAEIEETLAPVAMELISGWILARLVDKDMRAGQRLETPGDSTNVRGLAVSPE